VQRDWLSRLGGTFSSGPDTSATLFGPVHLGPTSPIGSEVATGTATAAPSAAIVATPVSEKSLDSSKPAEPATGPNNDSGKAKENTPTASSNADNGKPKDNVAAPSQSEAAKPAAPAKKKSRFHVLKKIVDPF
jgi:hypothetical protein